MNPVIRAGSRLIALAFALCTAACVARGDAAQVDATDAPVRAENVAALRLDSIGSVTLGAVDTESVFRIADFVPRGNRYYVVDGMARRVRAYDHTGRSLFSFGKKGDGLGDFDDPYQVSFLHDTLIVSDLGRAGYLMLFDPSGRFIDLAPSGVSRMPVGAVIADSAVFVAASIGRPDRDGFGMVRIAARNGRPLGSGCRIDQRYLDSEQKDGFLSHITVGSINHLGDRVYCWQTISPTVRVIDAAGNDHVVSRLAPPFYRAPRDEKFSMNAKKALEFASSYTAHSLFQPTPSGFVSVYSHFDRGTQRFAYDLFACDSSASSGSHCAAGPSNGRVLRVSPPDTAYVEERVAPGAPARVGIYRITRVAQ